MTTQDLTIQQVSEKTGLSVHTLRYYERIGLLQPVGRATNGHRRYSPADITRIELLNKLRTTGMPIRKLCEFAGLLSQGDSSIPQRLQVLEEHKKAVLEHIAEMERNLSAIDYKINVYKGKVEEQCKNES